MTAKPLPALLAALLAAGMAAACQSAGESRAGTPDEFRVVKKPPLQVPPEYNLRPPPAGTTLPSEVDPERARQRMTFGVSIGQGASAGERALVASAGASAANPIIRDQIDYEEAGVIRKRADVVDGIRSFEGGTVADNATGGEEITMTREGGQRIKLPGT